MLESDDTFEETTSVESTPKAEENNVQSPSANEEEDDSVNGCGDGSAAASSEEVPTGEEEQIPKWRLMWMVSVKPYC